jgi:hypothetical protein
MRVESFSMKKLLGVLASLVGIVLISTFDISGNSDDNRGSFPHKSQRQIAIGDGMALISAIMYGVYTLLMKKRIGNEGRVNMPLFFGLVGLFNVLFLWPGFFILHYTGEEIFQLPPTRQVWVIVLVSPSVVLVNVCTYICNSPILRQGQLHNIPRLRRLLGLCNASYITSDRHCWYQSDHSTLACWPDDPKQAVFRWRLLGRRRHRIPFFYLCQS